MNRIKITTMLAMLATALVFAACGGGNNAAAPAGGNTPAGNAPADNSTACAGTDGGTDNGGNNGGFDTAAERDAVVAKAWKYLEGMYDGDDKTMDENKVGIPGGWGRNSSNIPYTAMVLDAIIGTKVWDSKNPKIAESIDWLVSVQEPGGGYSYAPADVMPQAKGVRAVYITSIVATLFAQLNKMDGPWKGKLNDPIAKARDYIKQSQVGNADGPAPDYEKTKVGFGGWAYSKEEIDDAVNGKGKPASNMSTSSFAIDALHACGVSEDDPLWADALTFLKRNQNAGEVQDEGFEAMYKGKPLKMAEKGDPNYGGSIYSEETSKAGATENEDGTVTLASYGSMTYNLLRAYLFAGLKKDSVPVKLAWGWIQRNYTLERVPGYPDAADHNRGLYYYILSMSKTLDAMGVDMIEEPERGLKHDWKQDMVRRLKGLQKSDGSWVNDNEDWQEDSPVLCTCYALGALRRAK